ncbi:MAG: hypothetical protein KIT18_16160 [Burkholderiales bacterium]|nr:hypothetical protein [Burkholderiales bacterium]
MRIGKWLAAVAAALAFGMPAHAGERQPDPFAQIDPQVLFRGMVSEADVSLLFSYLRAAMLAASQGRDAPVPEELNRRAEALGNELKLRGMLAGLLLLNAIEQSAKEALREPPPQSRPAPPPVVSPFTAVHH